MILDEIISYFPEQIEMKKINNTSKDIADLVNNATFIKMLRDIGGSVYIKDKKKNDNHNIIYTLGMKSYFKTTLTFSNDKIEGYSFFHNHDYVELIYVLKGHFLHEIDGKYLEVKTNEGIILNTHIVHKNMNITNDDIALVLFFSKELIYSDLKDFIVNNSLLNKLLNSHECTESKEKYITFKAKPNNEIEKILLSIVREERNWNVGSKSILLGYSKRLFYNITHDSLELSLENGYKKHELSNFEKISKYIEENIADISREKVAKNFYYSSNYINQIIKSNTGFTYTQYVTNKRIEIAIELLRNSEYSINEIICKVGYINKGYFYREFRNRYGMTPNQLRKLDKKI